MTNIWQLSKESMKGIDLLAVSTDLLYILDQWDTQKTEMSQKELTENIKNGIRLLELLISTTHEQTTTRYQGDPFIFKVIESLEQSLMVQPSILLNRLEDGKTKLENGQVDTNLLTLFEKITQTIISITSRSVEAYQPHFSR